LALAVAVQRLMPEFSGIHPGRIAPAVTRFATAPAPWTAEQLVAAIRRMCTHRGWAIATQQIHPAPYLAMLLRNLDHLDQITSDPSTEAAHAPRDAAELRQERLLAREHEHAQERQLCQHGVAGADESTGRASRCAFCRHS
jgi:hypothetical protein